IEASDLSHLLEKSVESVSSNLDVVANSHAVSTDNMAPAVPLFNAAQNATKSLTSDYYWLDQNGKLILSSNGTSTIYPPGTGLDLSQREAFTRPRANETTYFSGATPSVTNSSNVYIFISRPIYAIQNNSALSHSRTFDGVVAAAIDVRTLGRSLQSDLSSKFQSSVGLLDFKGTILYSANEAIIGENVFGTAVQSSIPFGLRPEFNSFLNQSLKGQAGVGDLSYKGASGTIAYQPIFVNATTSGGNQIPLQFGVLYITATDTLAASAAVLIGQERSVSLIIIMGIASVSVGIAVTTLRWNKRLDDAVSEKTSDLLAANEKLIAKANAEKDLMNITAHELRTPTQSILANTEILRRVIRRALGIQQPVQIASNAINSLQEYDSLAGDIQPIEMVEMVESSYRNAQRLQKLTQNILEVARIDNKTFQLDKETFDLNELVMQSIEDMQALLNQEDGERPRLDISYEPKQPILLVDAERTKIGEVLSNLIDNAVKFSSEGGRIDVITDKKDQGYAIVSVKDGGSGIDPEILPRLFSKFATKTGTGLGLYISKAYVEAHGGTINAENNSDKEEGKAGAIFSFTIPLASASLTTK
ncbi:MAG: cache domain-containing sensor histidine kinase, partial [Nitrososphaerales archaeon]